MRIENRDEGLFFWLSKEEYQALVDAVPANERMCFNPDVITGLAGYQYLTPMPCATPWLFVYEPEPK